MRSMLKVIFNYIPQQSLQTWLDVSTIAAILLPLVGGLAALLAWGLNAHIAAARDIDDINRSQRLVMAENEISETARKLSDAEDRILQLQPKPLNIRIIEFSRRLDVRIVAAAKHGQRRFIVTLNTAQLSELQSLCAEDSLGKYITFIPTTNAINGGNGQHGGIIFELTNAIVSQL